jgi:hypothetical protein
MKKNDFKEAEAEEALNDNSAPLNDAEMVLNPEKDDYHIENQAVVKVQNAFHGQIIKKGEDIC